MDSIITKSVSEDVTLPIENELQSKNFTFESKIVTLKYILNDDTIWFVGKHIANMLGYKNTMDALLRYVSTCNVRQLGDLKPNATKTFLQNHTKFINLAGVYELTTKSKMPKVKEFQEWIMTEIIPSFKEELSNQTLPKLQCTETTEDGNNNKNGLLIQGFKFGSETLTFRYIHNDDAIWFVGKDIARMLGYLNTKLSIQMHVSDYNKHEFNQNLNGIVTKVSNQYPTVDATQTLQNHTILINEAGLYELIMKSKMPKAKEFQTWVTSEVLPSLRKIGKYSMKQASMKDATNLNVINKAIENGANAQWYKEKLELLLKNNALLLEIREKDKELISSLYENRQLQTKIINWKPLVASKPHRPQVFHLLELFSITAEGTKYEYGYFCSRIQERNAPNARPEPHDKSCQIFSIKCANSINAYNCLKEHIRETLGNHEYLIIGKRFYCNLSPYYIKLVFNDILSNNH